MVRIHVKDILYIVGVLLLIVVLLKLSAYEYERTSRNAEKLPKAVDSTKFEIVKGVDYQRRLQRDFPKPAVSWFSNHKFNNSIPDLRKYRLQPDSGVHLPVES